jgi:NADH-quinone oxidoreductase subunit G
LNLINPVDDDLLTQVANRVIVGPAGMAAVLAQVLKAAAESKEIEVPGDARNATSTVSVSDTARAMAASLIDNKPAAIFLGNLAQHHPQYTDILVLAQHIAQITDAQFGVLGEAANSVGAHIAGVTPGRRAPQGSGSLSAAEMLGMSATSADPAGTAAQPCQAYILMNLEPELDSYNPGQATKALSGAELVVMLTSYKSQAIMRGSYADVLLPIAPFTETSGTFISTEGRVQTFNGVVAPLGETRPAWKILRVLGNMLQLDGFDYETPDQVRAEILSAGTDVSSSLNNSLDGFTVGDIGQKGDGIQRIGEVPIYQSDPIVRRAESLQRTSDAAAPVAWMTGALMDKLGIQAGDDVRLMQGEGEAQLPAARDDTLPVDCVRVASAHPMTASLGGMFGEIVVERL